MARASQLANVMRERRLVRFSRRFEVSSIRGYVLDVGPRFFLLALVSDRILFDGFECFRVSDVSNLRMDPYSAFAEAALRKRGERTPRRPKVNLTSLEDLLLSAGRAFPLVAIHCEQANPEVCHIGRVVQIMRRRVSLLEIGPDATWDRSPTEYQLGQITRVSFGGDYEDALHIVGGDPMQINNTTARTARTRPLTPRISPYS